MQRAIQRRCLSLGVASRGGNHSGNHNAGNVAMRIVFDNFNEVTKFLLSKNLGKLFKGALYSNFDFHQNLIFY